MEHTKLLYLNDSYNFNSTALVLEKGKSETGKNYIILDQTIFYPQGGGQPYDQGEISKDEIKLIVDEVRFIDGLVYHLGSSSLEGFKKDDKVELRINEERRKLHAKLHSAGHMVDVAVHELGYDLIGTKGYHFPEGPYVEFSGQLPDDATLKKKIEDKLNELIEKGFEVKTEIVNSISDLEEKCYHIPEFIPKDKPIRLAYVCGPMGEACGGTHVKDIKEIGHVTIPKIKYKKGITRISYDI